MVIFNSYVKLPEGNVQTFQRAGVKPPSCHRWQPHGSPAIKIPMGRQTANKEGFDHPTW